ncbi:MAG: nuclear transport factor 2 family protein [Sulfitobacter sp.]|nr:nuclear transport factor 2 family protein [Sulfitobacter sp.]
MTKADIIALEGDLHSAENEVWEALVRGDAEADKRLLSGDFLGIYPDGFSGRADHLAQLSSGPSIWSYRLDSFHTRALGPDHAVLSYRAKYLRAKNDKGETMYVSSIWQRAPTGWINILSQDTPAKVPSQGM